MKFCLMFPPRTKILAPFLLAPPPILGSRSLYQYNVLGIPYGMLVLSQSLKEIENR